MTVIGYTFKAENYCPAHVMPALTADPEYDGWELGEGITMPVEQNLNEIAYHFGIDREREHTFESDNFPKVVLRHDVNAAESRCGTCDVALIDAEHVVEVQGRKYVRTFASELEPGDVTVVGEVVQRRTWAGNRVIIIHTNGHQCAFSPSSTVLVEYN